MRAAGISGLLARKRRRTTVRLPGVRVAPDLLERDFRPEGPNQTWSADITYISTWEGFVYLAHVQDLFSRLIVGWSMAEHLRAELVVGALEMALARRRPGPGLVHHSDQGCQGGFNRSSQRSSERSCDGSQASEVGSGSAAGVEVAGASAGGASGASSALLGGDRSWGVERGCRSGSWGVGGGWRPVVSGGWRDAVSHPCPAVGPVSVVRRAGGDRDFARERLWRAGDRSSARSVAVDDFPGASSQRGDPWRRSRVSGVECAVACGPTRPASEAREAGHELRPEALCAGPALGRGRAAWRDHGGRSECCVGRSAARPAQGSALVQVVEP